MPPRVLPMPLTLRSTALIFVPLLLLSSLPSASAQVGTLLDKSKLPACALQCQNLLSAQAVCVPPSAQVTDQTTYQTCFCQSAYLATFKQSPIDICGGVCTAGELQSIQSWYDGLCTPGGPVVTPNQNGAEQVPAATTTAAAAATTTSSPTSSPKSSKHSGPSWISTHYRWIVMIIVLFLASIGFTILGLWLKRRKDAKHGLPTQESNLAIQEAAASLRSRHPDTGSMAQLPSWERASVAMSSREMVAATPPPGAVRPAGPYHSGSGGGAASSSKGKERAQLTEVRETGASTEDAEPPARSGSRRLGKKGIRKFRR